MKKAIEVNVILVLLLYMVIYNPPIFTINCIRVLMFPCWLYLFINRKGMNKYINLRKVITAEILIGLLLTYGITIAIINNNPPTNFTHLFYWFAGDIPFALSVWIYLKKRNQGFRELILHIVIAGVIMAITSVAALVSPSIKTVFTQKMLDYGVQYAERLSVYRNYGFAANLTSFASMLQSVICITCVFKAVRGEKKYILLFPLLALSAIINTRSSILFLAFGILVIFIVTVKKGQFVYVLRFIGIGILVLGFAEMGLNIIQTYNPQTLTWLTSGYGSIISFVTGSSSNLGYFGELEHMIFDSFPSGIELIVGVGSGVMGNTGAAYGVRSDVGFINDLWRGGILYFAIILFLYLTMLKHIYHSNILDKETVSFFSLYFFIIFILTNIKGSFFIHSDLTVVFWLIYTALVFNSDNHEKYKFAIGLRR